MQELPSVVDVVRYRRSDAGLGARLQGASGGGVGAWLQVGVGFLH